MITILEIHDDGHPSVEEPTEEREQMLTSLASMDQEIKSLRAEVLCKKNLAETLALILDRRTAQRDKTKAGVKELTGMIASLEDEKAVMKNEIAGLLTRIAQLKGRVILLEDNLKYANEGEIKLRRKINDLKTNYELETKARAEREASKNAEIGNLKRDLEDRVVLYKKLLTQNGQLREEVSFLKSRLEGKAPADEITVNRRTYRLVQ